MRWQPGNHRHKCDEGVMTVAAEQRLSTQHANSPAAGITAEDHQVNLNACTRRMLDADDSDDLSEDNVVRGIE